MKVWNVVVPVVALVSASSEQEAIDKLKARISAMRLRGGMFYPLEDDARSSAFESEPGTEADL